MQPPKKPTLFTQIQGDQTTASEFSKDITHRNDLSLTLTIYLEKGGHLMATLLGYIMRVAAPGIFNHPQEPIPKLKNLLEQIFKIEHYPKDEFLTHSPISFTAKLIHPSEKTPPTLTIFMRSIDTRVELKILASGRFNPDLIVEYMRFLMGQLDLFSQVKAELTTPSNANSNDLDLAARFAEFFVRGIQIQGTSPAAQQVINQFSRSGQIDWKPRFMPLGPDGKPIRPGQPGNTTEMSGPRQ